MKKKFIIGLGLLSLIPIIANAKDAYSVGTDYGMISTFKSDIDTSQDAKEAAETFYTLGYNSYYNTKPTYDYLRGNNPNTGKPRMESEILFFAGHGSVDHMVFNYQKKFGDYATGVYYGESYETSNNFRYAGIESYDMTKVRLAIYAGCLTGHIRSGDSKGCLALNTANLGANGAIGWWESVNDKTFLKWERSFFEGLILGNDVEAAIEYANNFNYDDSRVKNVVYNGDMHLQIGANTYSLNKLEKKDKIKNAKKLLITDINKEINDLETIENQITYYIKENIDSSFNILNYKIEKNETFINQEKITYYDYKQLLNDAILDYGFTIVVKNNKIIKIVDNRININSIVQNQNNSITFNANINIEQMKKQTKEEIEKNCNLEVKDQEVNKKYNTETNQYIWNVRNVIYEKDSDTYYVKTIEK